MTSAWAAIPEDRVCFNYECSVELETIKATDDGVIWSAAHKNGGPGDYIETPELAWTVIERLAAAKTPKALVGLVPAAHFEDSSDDDTGTTEEDASAAEA